MSDHTPGPWRAESEYWPSIRDGNTWWRIYAGGEDDANLIANIDRTNRDPKDGIVIEVGRTADPKPFDITRDAANAKLIAAAPELLAACKRAAQIERLAVSLGAMRSPVYLQELHDAIAKAEGGTR